MKRNETLGPTVVRTTVNTDLLTPWHWRPVAYDRHIFQRSLAVPKQLRAPARGSGVKRATQFALNAGVALAPEMTCRSATVSRQWSW
jgi:hypothetical protein